MPGVALARQATLSGTTLSGSFTTSGFSCFPTRFAYDASGQVAGPTDPSYPGTSAYYPGTFTQQGAVSDTFSARFTIKTSSGTTVTGTASGPIAASCARGGATSAFSSGGGPSPSGSYQATITTADGTSYSDAGSAFAAFYGQAPGEQNLAGQSRLSFYSRYAEAQPIEEVTCRADRRADIRELVVAARTGDTALTREIVADIAADTRACGVPRTGGQLWPLTPTF